MTDLLTRFESFCRIDRNLSDRTVSHNNGYPWQVKRFLEAVGKQPMEINSDDVRNYLTRFEGKSPCTKANVLKALKVFFKHFLQRPEVTESFRFPKKTYRPIQVPSKEDLKRFFEALENDRDRAIFLMYATSGLRRNELLGLTVDDLDLENRTIVPKNAHTTGTTKNTWATCFNEEAQTYLKRYLQTRQTQDRRLFQISQTTLRRMFRSTHKRTGLDIRPQVLRDWFCCQLGELGVPDRYVDAFCGRVPKSVLARHYTDYSPEKLKRIYDRANLTVLA